jgi:hypothetical protein
MVRRLSATPQKVAAGAPVRDPTFDPAVDLEPPAWAPWWPSTMDRLSIALPFLAAALSGAAGWASLGHHDVPAAWFGMLGALTGAGGVLATGAVSRVRDRQQRRMLAQIWSANSMAKQALNLNTSSM